MRAGDELGDVRFVDHAVFVAEKEFEQPFAVIAAQLVQLRQSNSAETQIFTLLDHVFSIAAVANRDHDHLF